MKRFLFISMMVFLVVMIWVSVHDKDDKHLAQKFKQAMELTQMKEYHDENYDYVVRYPAFFEQTDDSLIEKGTCRFSFWQDSTEIVQTAFVKHNPKGMTLDQAMEKYASELYATYQQKGKDSFILSGHIHDDDGRLTSRRFYARFVQHRKLWFVQAIAYPEDCEQAVQRLIKEINDWKVWRNC